MINLRNRVSPTREAISYDANTELDKSGLSMFGFQATQPFENPQGSLLMHLFAIFDPVFLQLNTGH